MGWGVGGAGCCWPAHVSLLAIFVHVIVVFPLTITRNEWLRWVGVGGGLDHAFALQSQHWHMGGGGDRFSILLNSSPSPIPLQLG